MSLAVTGLPSEIFSGGATRRSRLLFGSGGRRRFGMRDLVTIGGRVGEIHAWKWADKEE